MKSYNKDDYNGMGLNDAEIERMMNRVMCMSRDRDAHGRFNSKEKPDHEPQFVKGTEVRYR